MEKLNQLTTTGGPHGRGGGAASESEQQWHNKQLDGSDQKDVRKIM